MSYDAWHNLWLLLLLYFQRKAQHRVWGADNVILRASSRNSSASWWSRSSELQLANIFWLNRNWAKQLNVVLSNQTYGWFIGYHLDTIICHQDTRTYYHSITPYTYYTNNNQMENTKWQSSFVQRGRSGTMHSIVSTPYDFPGYRLQKCYHHKKLRSCNDCCWDEADVSAF